MAEELNTPPRTSLAIGASRSPVESVGSNTAIPENCYVTPDPYTRNSGVGPNNVADEYGQNTDVIALTENMNSVSLNDSGDVNGISEYAQNVNKNLDTLLADYDETQIPQDSMEEEEVSSGTSYTEACSEAAGGINFEQRKDDEGKTYFIRKGFPQGPRVTDKQQQEKELRELKKRKGIADDDSILKSLEQLKNAQILSQDSQPTYNSLEKLKNDKPEYEDLWQVSFMPKAYVCKTIRDFYLQKPKEGHGCFLLKTETEVVYCEELQCYVLKGNSTYRCEEHNEKTRIVFVRIDTLFVLIHTLLQEDTTVNIRWIPYAFREIFSNTREVEYVLDRICKGIGCTRDSLNIFASAKGKIAGDISFKVITRGGRSYRTNCEGGVVIEPRDVPQKLEFELTNEEPYLVLIVEKDTIFQRLVEADYHRRFRCIIITGCGKPDVATRTLLQKVQKDLNLPVVALIDHNAGGFEIYLTYLCGSVNMAHEDLHTPNIKWLGLSPSDLIEHNIAYGKEKVGLETIKNKDFVKKSPELAEELGKMETKVDVESTMKGRPLQYLTEIFMPLKFKRLGEGRTYN